MVMLALEPGSRLPVMGEAINQLLLSDAVHVRVCRHVPLALRLAFCGVGLGCPTTPVKLRAAGVRAMVQGGSTVKLTGSVCGLPLTGEPELSVPLMVIVPV